MTVLKKFIGKFSRLRVDRSKSAPAPHKPILLLSIISEIEKGNISENKIYITPELVGQYILLPSIEDHYPSQLNLAWHRKRFKFC